MFTVCTGLTDVLVTSVQTTRCYIRMGCYYRALVAELTMGVIIFIRVGRYNQGGVILQRLRYFYIFLCMDLSIYTVHTHLQQLWHIYVHWTGFSAGTGIGLECATGMWDWNHLLVGHTIH